MVSICGIDGAGRGPVIGPLVMCGVKVHKEGDILLKSIGVKDSKLLTPEKRDELFDKIKKIVDSYEILISSAGEVDDALASKDMNLNWLKAKKSSEILNKLKPDKAYLDCPSNNIDAYRNYVKNLLDGKIELIVEHKADLNYPVAAAASILAKVTRDREIEKIKSEVGINFGSGYPSDETTQEFLKKNWQKYPDIFRKSWASYKRAADAKNQKSLGDF